MYVLITCLCALLGFISWGDSLSDFSSLSGVGGRGIIFIIPFVVLITLWESFIFPEGSITFALFVFSIFSFYVANHYHKKQINYVEFVGPPRLILSKEQLKSNFWGVIISFSVVVLCLLSPVFMVLFVS